MQKYFQRLEETLKKRGVKKTALAAHLHVALSTISRWKVAMPRVETIQATAEFLGVSAQWLTTGEIQNAVELPPKPESPDMAVYVSDGNPNESEAPGEKKITVEELAERVAELNDQLAVLTGAMASLVRGGENPPAATPPAGQPPHPPAAGWEPGWGWGDQEEEVHEPCAEWIMPKPRSWHAGIDQTSHSTRETRTTKPPPP